MLVVLRSLLVALLMIRIGLVALSLRWAYIWQHSLIGQPFSSFNCYLVVQHVNLFGVHFVQYADHFRRLVFRIVGTVVSHEHL